VSGGSVVGVGVGGTGVSVGVGSITGIKVEVGSGVAVGVASLMAVAVGDGAAQPVSTAKMNSVTTIVLSDVLRFVERLFMVCFSLCNKRAGVLLSWL
jgi:hypothetical protein